MNIPRVILDGIVMCVIFNSVVGLFFMVVPQAYSVMFPKSLKEAAAPYVKKEELKICTGCCIRCICSCLSIWQ